MSKVRKKNKKLKGDPQIRLALDDAIEEMRSEEFEAGAEADMLDEALDHYEKTGHLRRDARYYLGIKSDGRLP